MTIGAIGLFAVSVIAGPPLPKVEGLHARGCSIEELPSGAVLHVWADHQFDLGNGEAVLKRDFEMKWSERTGKNGLAKAMQDCREFLAAVDKAVAGAKK